MGRPIEVISLLDTSDDDDDEVVETKKRTLSQSVRLSRRSANANETNYEDVPFNDRKQLVKRRRQNLAKRHGPVHGGLYEDESSDESSDSDDDAPFFCFTKKRLPAPRDITQDYVGIQALPMPTKSQQNAILDKIESPVDRRLQQLLWHIGCRYTLLPHQCIGVRRITGVQNNFPPDLSPVINTNGAVVIDPDPLTPSEFDQLLRDAKFDGNRGVLQADEMGLGKVW